MLAANGSKIPEPCFISHAYQDRVQFDTAIRLLATVQTRAHPPINVPPRDYVSDSLVSMIEGCRSLIAVQGPSAAQSYWMNFEIQYAARIGLPIFELEEHSRILRPVKVDVNELRVFIQAPGAGQSVGANLVKFLSRRHFKAWFDEPTLGQSMFDDLRLSDKSISDFKFLLVLLSSENINSEILMHRWRQLERLHLNHLFVLLEPNLPIPEFARFHQLNAFPVWERADPFLGFNANLVDTMMTRLLLTLNQGGLGRIGGWRKE